MAGYRVNLIDLCIAQQFWVVNSINIKQQQQQQDFKTLLTILL